jgi:PPK2 family polyphosphate:nucleotide phosphotransferase
VGVSKLARRVRVAPGEKVDLAERRPDDKLGRTDRAAAEAQTEAWGEQLAMLGGQLVASEARALLLVLQGMDASGKDGTVKHCFGKLSPSTLRIASFKGPTPEELAHDFLWRISRELPRRGQIGVFNRSHYEDVLVVRVEELVPRERWEPRYEAINAFEEHLVREGTVIVKVFLHVSQEEQAERFQERLEDPTKRWKFDAADLDKRAKWDAYMEAYRVMLERTSTQSAPWHVVPADRPWLRNHVVTALLVDALDDLGLAWPDLDPAVAKDARIT